MTGPDLITAGIIRPPRSGRMTGGEICRPPETSMAAEWEWIAPAGTAIGGVLAGYGTLRKLVSAARKDEVQTITEAFMRMVDSLRAQILEAAREREAIAAERARERSEFRARIESLETAVRSLHSSTCQEDCENRKPLDPSSGFVDPPR